jgi:hypothetical protein
VPSEPSVAKYDLYATENGRYVRPLVSSNEKLEQYFALTGSHFFALVQGAARLRTRRHRSGAVCGAVPPVRAAACSVHRRAHLIYDATCEQCHETPAVCGAAVSVCQKVRRVHGGVRVQCWASRSLHRMPASVCDETPRFSMLHIRFMRAYAFSFASRELPRRDFTLSKRSRSLIVKRPDDTERA